MDNPNIETTYETLDYLASKSMVFTKVRDEIRSKDTRIAELEGMVMELTMALALVAGGGADV